MSSAEKRRSERFKVGIPIELKLGTGITRDCSVDGVYFMTDQPLSVGEQIEFVMPLNHQGSGNVVRLNCRADVVRVDPDSDKTGAAVAITNYVFETAPELAEATIDNRRWRQVTKTSGLPPREQLPGYFVPVSSEIARNDQSGEQLHKLKGGKL